MINCTMFTCVCRQECSILFALSINLFSKITFYTRTVGLVSPIWGRLSRAPFPDITPFLDIISVYISSVLWSQGKPLLYKTNIQICFDFQTNCQKKCSVLSVESHQLLSLSLPSNIYQGKNITEIISVEYFFRVGPTVKCNKMIHFVPVLSRVIQTSHKLSQLRVPKI